jgi:hypothetical protein
MLKTSNLRRLYEAAVRDRNEERFFDDLREGLAKKEIRPEDFSLRQLFEQFAPHGREIIDSWTMRHGGAGGYSLPLLEEAGAVTTAGFSKISGQIVYSAILDAFNSEQFVFSSLVRTIPTSLNGEQIAGLSRIGDEAEIVGEAKPYPLAGFSEDYIETPTTTKRGLIVGITKEAIFFDRTGVIIDRCREVGEFLGLNKEKRVIDCVIDENSTAHRYKWKGTNYATYQATTPWVNVTASNALVDWTDIDAAEQTMANLVDPATGEPILVTPKHLVVTRQLLYTARRIVNASEIRIASPGYATSGNPTQTLAANPVMNYQIVTSLLLASRMATDTNWFIGDIGKGFAYMENWPMTVTPAPSNSEIEFTQDIVARWKASERGAAATLEPRAMHKSTA